MRARSNWNLKVLVFKERGKPEYPEKNLSEQGREPTTNSTHIWRRRQESNPGHIGGRRVLSPLRHPCSPNPDIYIIITCDWITIKRYSKHEQSTINMLPSLKIVSYYPLLPHNGHTSQQRPLSSVHKVSPWSPKSPKSP